MVGRKLRLSTHDLRHVVLLSEDAAAQQWLARIPLESISVVTRHMLLDANWLAVRDRFLQKPDTMILMELPKVRTATGTRNDRKVMDRMVTYISPNSMFAIFAPQRSNSWDSDALQHVLTMPGAHSSLHSACAWGIRNASGTPLKLVYRMITNRPLQSTRCPHDISVRHESDFRYLSYTTDNDVRLQNRTDLMGHVCTLAIGADLTVLTGSGSDAFDVALTDTTSRATESQASGPHRTRTEAS